jgi:ubiquinone/menaquinone biosynthesis C-methylase UbiE
LEDLFMNDASRQAHWEKVYGTKDEEEVSWFQENPAPSLDLIELTGVSAEADIIDIGGGASRLVDDLLARAFCHITVLDLSETALASAESRVGDSGATVRWVVADVTKWEPPQMYDLWHDRAAFHFLTENADQSAYVDRLRRAVKLGGHVVIGTFALDGPESCSGLPIMRHDASTLAAIFGRDFVLMDTRRHDHTTPWGTVQRFQFSTFRRAALI